MALVNPIETLFVVDSMTGQDAAHTAKVFADALPLTGIILNSQGWFVVIFLAPFI
jgi:signal recognition particle GTPase